MSVPEEATAATARESQADEVLRDLDAGVDAARKLVLRAGRVYDKLAGGVPANVNVERDEAEDKPARAGLLGECLDKIDELHTDLFGIGNTLDSIEVVLGIARTEGK